MQIVRLWLDSLLRADILRRAMGKKKRQSLIDKKRFVNGAIKNGINRDVANFVLQKLNHLLNMVLIRVMPLRML